MYLTEYLDTEKLAQYVKEGLVERRDHPTLDLHILCYSKKAVFGNVWDDVLVKCRGLIYDSNLQIVSRPFPKFFNLDTQSRPETLLGGLLDKSPIVTDKLDGSLGILWEFEGQTGIASKGSFQSEHANWATAWYLKNCPNPQWPLGFTPVFEMICQCVQKHVVTYDIADQLVLLALINNETGEEADYNTIYHYAYLNGLKVAEVFSKGIMEVVAEDRQNKEGYVLTWPRAGQSPLKVKVKHETFLKLQKIVHNATPKNILEALSGSEYELVDAWAAESSPELAEFIRGWSSQFTETYVRVILKARRIVEFANFNYETRKEKAEHILHPSNKPYATIAFAILDGKDPRKTAWKYVENTYKDEMSTRAPIAYDEDEV